MLSLDFICQHPDLFRTLLLRRGVSVPLEDILQLATERRELVTQNDEAHRSLKELKMAVRSVPVAEKDTCNRQMKAIRADIQQREKQLVTVEQHLRDLLMSVPNLPHASVVERADEEDIEVRRWGEPASFAFDPRPHWELGSRLGIIDSDTAVKIAGSRFVMLKGMGARLERALISFMLDIHTRQHGYTEVLLPQLVKEELMFAAGQFPKFADQSYRCEADELVLNPTAEVPLVGLHSQSILPVFALPRRYVAWTTAYRREAGSASRHNRGLLRLHQFNKVELFQYVDPQESYRSLEEMVQHAEKILQLLGLPYRVVELTARHLSFSAAKTVDIEVWMAGQGEYVEVSSVSNCEAFQARRANIKYRGTGKKHTGYVHTLNGSGLAVGRTMAAILEAYQQKNGAISIPDVLQSYMGTAIISPEEGI